jgi:hypothetical protein
MTHSGYKLRIEVLRAVRGVVLGVCLTLVWVASSSAMPSTKPFELVSGSFHLTPSTVQAGAHEDLTTQFDFAHNSSGHTFNDPRTVVVNLPAGFTGNNTAVPTCTFGQLLSKQPTGTVVGEGVTATACPPEAQVGVITIDLTGLSTAEPVQRVTYPIYNMETTSFGVTAELGFKADVITGALLVSVRPGDSGLTVTSSNIEEISEPHAISATVWGLPAAASHDAERGMECFYNAGGGRPNPLGGSECFGGGEKVSIPVKPFLSNPTSCATFTASMRADSWEDPEKWSSAEAHAGPITGCEHLHFDPSIEALPTTDAAESPSGLDISLSVPQSWQEPFTLATSNLQDAKVTLPQGYTVNPSAGSGVVGCSPQQYESETYSSPPGTGCPPESKLGTVDIETPVLAEKISGNLYLATPYENVPEFGDPRHPNGSLLALYVVAKAPDRGIVVKTAGKVEPDPVTGQLTSTFDNTPQQPFSKFTIKLRQGATSPLVSPPTCGTYTIQAELTPWSAPMEPRFQSNSFQIEKGVGGGACPAGGAPPFKPQIISGTQSNAGGSYSPFYLRIVRADGEQEITKFTTILPPGLTGNLTGVPFCPDAQIETARGATGLHELNEPSCPPASEIGHTIVGAGVGSVLAQTPGKVYLAGSYHGSALSIVSVTSATVGPFDLGTVVIRFGLKINPLTAQVEVDGASSDPIPHIIDGIVVHVRDIRVYMSRPNFIENPTSCDPMSLSETITGAGADPSNPADGTPVTVSAPFQAADCSNLGFKPSFKASTSGRTSRRNGASLSVKLVYPKAPQGSQANIRSVKVDLPKQLPSRLTTLQKACADSAFNANPGACPVASRVGTAKAITPILPVPLEGPAYFVSHGGLKFPELVIVLQGYGFTIDLHGETFISKAGITSSTFRAVPDQPVTSFELTLPQGPNSALAANGNLCSLKRTITRRKRIVVTVHGHRHTVTRTIHRSVSGALAMPTVFTAQNGFVIHQSTPISVTGCARPVTKSGARLPAAKTKRK